MDKRALKGVILTGFIFIDDDLDVFMSSEDFGDASSDSTFFASSVNFLEFLSTPGGFRSGA